MVIYIWTHLCTNEPTTKNKKNSWVGQVIDIMHRLYLNINRKFKLHLSRHLVARKK